MHAQTTFSGQRVAIYARFSSERQRETSIDDQVDRCRRYIVEHGGDVDRVIVFTDYATSGASLDRPGFEALMQAVKAKRIDAIVTEDISRISRDFADSARVFKQLRYARIPLIGIADGIDTSTRDAKLAFTLKSLVADLYLDDLRDKTLRGLEGRARAGYATGNTPYGYRTVPDTDGSGRVRGHRIEIDDEQAVIVRRIFDLHRAGRSLSAIARALNEDGIPSPRAGTRHKRSGWGASTIRAMLYNERYIGVWKFKQTQWVKVPGTNKRRARKRDAHEVITMERPELRIIDARVWDGVRSRLDDTRRRYSGGKRSGQTRRTYLLSGLLYCGACRSPMTIVGGSSAAYYRCSRQRTKGTCDNALSVREDVARPFILDQVRDLLSNREIITHVRDVAVRQLSDIKERFEIDLREHRARLSKLEARIQRLIDHLADGESSDYVRQSLRDLEVQAKDEKSAITSLTTHTRAVEFPSVDEIIATAVKLDGVLRTDVDQGREHLRKLFQNGEIFLVPTDGAYKVESKLFPLAHANANDIALFDEQSGVDEKTTEERENSNDSALFRGGSGGRI